MALWCRDCPHVRVARGDTPKRVTFVYPYYCNPEFLAYQLRHWSIYPADLRARLTVIVVDDGSPVPATVPPDLPLAVRLFRIAHDVRWNWLAARNIGAYHAAEGWLLLTDMDHVVPAETLEALLYGQHDPQHVYGFMRREHTGAPVAPHSASFFLTRARFWQIGGYDEALSGHYGTDGEYRRRIRQHAPILILADVLERHEYCGDSSTTTYQRKQPIDAAVRRIVHARPPDWRPTTLSFPYEEIPCT